MSPEREHPLVVRRGPPAEISKAPADLAMSVSTLERAIAEAVTPDDAIKVGKLAGGLRHMAHYARMSLEQQNIFARLRLVAEMRAGRLLAESRLRGGDRKSQWHASRVKLDDLGIDHNESSRYQKLARFSEILLDEYASLVNSDHRELTYAGFIRWAANGECRGPSGPAAHFRNGHGNNQGSQSAGGTGRELTETLDELQNHWKTIARLLQPVFDEQGCVAMDLSAPVRQEVVCRLG